MASSKQECVYLSGDEHWTTYPLEVLLGEDGDIPVGWVWLMRCCLPRRLIAYEVRAEWKLELDWGGRRRMRADSKRVQMQVVVGWRWRRAYYHSCLLLLFLHHKMMR